MLRYYFHGIEHYKPTLTASEEKTTTQRKTPPISPKMQAENNDDEAVLNSFDSRSSAEIPNDVPLLYEDRQEKRRKPQRSRIWAIHALLLLLNLSASILLGISWLNSSRNELSLIYCMLLSLISCCVLNSNASTQLLSKKRSSTRPDSSKESWGLSVLILDLQVRLLTQRGRIYLQTVTVSIPLSRIYLHTCFQELH